MADYALTLSDVTGHGLGPASLAVLPGEIAGLVGPAGAGKTRLLRVAAGSLKPRTGEVRVSGVRVAHSAARRLIGYACDSPAFPCALTVEEAALGGRRVLLLDETLSGLDAFARRDLCGRIARLAAEGVAVLITARDPAA